MAMLTTRMAIIMEMWVMVMLLKKNKTMIVTVRTMRVQAEVMLL